MWLNHPLKFITSLFKLMELILSRMRRFIISIREDYPYLLRVFLLKMDRVMSFIQFGLMGITSITLKWTSPLQICKMVHFHCSVQLVQVLIITYIKQYFYLKIILCMLDQWTNHACQVCRLILSNWDLPCLIWIQMHA